MDSRQFRFCRQWFEDYTAGYHSSDKEIERNIDLKLQHTYRVCTNIKRIASTIGIRGKDQTLAEVIALFHDVGRFEQLKTYGTFNDGIILRFYSAVTPLFSVLKSFLCPSVSLFYKKKTGFPVKPGMTTFRGRAFLGLGVSFLCVSVLG